MMGAQIVPKLHNCVKRGFLGKTYQCRLCQSIVIYHTKIFQNKLYGRSRDIRLNNFWENCAQFVLFLENVFFFFLWKMTNDTISHQLYPNMQQSLKKIFGVRQIMKYKVLQFWDYQFTLKGEFFFWLKNWLMLILPS